MKAYFFNIEKDTENKEVPVLETYQSLARTQNEGRSVWDNKILPCEFSYDIKTGELIFTNWIAQTGAVPA
jgi:hypothetical protein